jgi:transposase
MPAKQKATVHVSAENINLYKVALELWLTGTKSVEHIAQIVGVSRQTVHNWAKENDWESLRAAQLRPTQQRIAALERQMNALEDWANGDEDGPRMWDNKQADLYIKWVSAREKLSTTSIGQVVQMIHDISNYALRNMPEASKDIARCLDGYLTEYTATINKGK